jgi:predicted site-specific integrase-resolvase
MSKQHFSVIDISRATGISVRTLRRWLKDGKIPEAPRDRNNHRIFDKQAIKQIMAYVNKVTPPTQPLQMAHTVKESRP